MRLMGRDLSAGTTVSAVGHVVLIVWLLTGWGLSHEPLPFDVTEVSVVSGEEYARLVAATTPQPATEIGAAPQAPTPDIAPPPPDPTPSDPTPPTPEPQPATPAAETPPPEPPEPVPPPAEVTEQVTELVTPETSTPPPAPEASTRPAPLAAPRVAPQAVAPPPPDANVAPDATEEATPEAQAPEIVPEPAQAAAPEAAATEIVTEAEPPSGAVETSLRPQARPNRPAPQSASAPSEPPAAEAAAEPEAEPATASVEDDIAAAVAAAAAEQPESATAANLGDALTSSELGAFRRQVSGCWGLDEGAEAARLTVTVVFELGRDGKLNGPVTLIGSDSGSDAAITAAFESARRAVIRCQGPEGYSLPEDKFEIWRQVEMTFDPNGMRLR